MQRQWSSRVLRRWTCSSRGMWCVAVVGASVVLVYTMFGVVPAPAAADVSRADDALRACGVTSVDEARRTAVVPVEFQDGYFTAVPTAADPSVLLCGNGVTTGAVHIEVKHNVPNWADAINCMENAIRHGQASQQPDRTVYMWRFLDKTMFVVDGEYSVITAYPSDGLEESWIECSAAA